MQNLRRVFGFLLVLAATPSHAFEGLDEMMARRDRIDSSQWGSTDVEDPSSFVWQPETLWYLDQATGHEVWVVARTPRGTALYSKEHGTDAWSHDGSRLGVFVMGRTTAHPNIRSDRAFIRMVVNSDGSQLRPAEGYGKYNVPLGGFGWAHTELAYYTFGSHATIDAPLDTLTKNTISPDNSVSGEVLLQVEPATGQKGLIKEGVSSDDRVIVARSGDGNELGRHITCAAVYRIDLYPTPTLDIGWGVARGCGPYLTHQDIDVEFRWHDCWSPGPSPQHVWGQYSGGGSGFYRYAFHGTDAFDNGPVWSGWDSAGQSFGEISLESDGLGTPFGTVYWGHPTFDRWGRFALIGDYTDSEKGTRVWDFINHSWPTTSGHIGSGYYDGGHHSWAGWTDHVIFEYDVDGYDVAGARYIYGARYDEDTVAASASTFTVGDTSYRICDTHFPPYENNYNAYPRPSQSPDGTKVAFSATWLNDTGDDYPYISWAVAYPPKPPSDLSASLDGGVRISWVPPRYTDRGWPDEQSDPAPYAREIARYHVWRSPTGTGDWQHLGSVSANYTRDDRLGPVATLSDCTFVDTGAEQGISYYALTSEEHSRLESQTLSQVLMVTLSGASLQQEVASPAGQADFWLQRPPAPTDLQAVSETAGHYRLSWSNPQDDMVRFYNIYYASDDCPEAVAARRIASLPLGTTTYLDWQALPSASAWYGITAVDRYGNESLIVYPAQGLGAECGVVTDAGAGVDSASPRVDAGQTSDGETSDDAWADDAFVEPVDAGEPDTTPAADVPVDDARVLDTASVDDAQGPADAPMAIDVNSADTPENADADGAPTDALVRDLKKDSADDNIGEGCTCSAPTATTPLASLVLLLAVLIRLRQRS